MLRCQDMFSTQEKPSGLMLVDLVRNDIGAILSKEKGNMFRIYLYSLGNYWTAFESSAYRLCRLGGKAVVLPMRVAGLAAPVVAACLDKLRVRELVSGLDCVEHGQERRVYQTREALDRNDYLLWHVRKTRPVLDVSVEETQSLRT